MSTQLLWDGLKAMILGMGMVYVFLVIMIWIMHLTSKLLKPYAGFLEPKKNSPKTARKTTAAAPDRELAGAAVDAVRQYLNGNHAGKPATLAVSCCGKTVHASVAVAGNGPAAVVKTDAGGALTTIRSPLPGTIMRLEVNEGASVSAGDVLAVIEAMKMETEIRAEHDGVVREILVAPKDVVASEQALLRMEVKA